MSGLRLRVEGGERSRSEVVRRDKMRHTPLPPPPLPPYALNPTLPTASPTLPAAGSGGAQPPSGAPAAQPPAQINVFFDPLDLHHKSPDFGELPHKSWDVKTGL